MVFSYSDLAHFWTVLVSLSLFPYLVFTSSNDDCQLLQSTVPIARVTTALNLGYPVPVVCSGDVMLNKCEGTCESSVSPSVTTHPGFKKNCRCCKETSTTTKEVYLPICVHNGKIYPDYQHKIWVKEITGCQCQACTG
ncbi:partner of bursicon-like [Biomphalaria glabrata]|uniref:Partner of bursicon-like n=1 Tax=Biomphalaria glabrata TaxID=6526 RepID=A0A9W3ACH8_BIOGL|nr:partner of bursicon-like [Biomphalaria glabrata]